MNATNLDIDYGQWMRDTELSGLRRRSAGLQKLDRSIEQYCRSRTEANAWAIRQNYDLWQNSRTTRRGPDAAAAPATSRDGRGAVTRLVRALDDGGINAESYRAAHFSTAETDADNIIMSKRSEIARIFEGGKVVFLGSAAVAGAEKKTTIDKMLHPVSTIQSTVEHRSSTAWEHVRKKIGISDTAEKTLEKTVGIAGVLYAAVDAVFGHDIWPKIEATAIGTEITGLIRELAASVPPWVGQVWDARSTWNAMGSTIDTAVQRLSLVGRHYDIDTGSPVSALSGIRTCLRHELEHNATDASIASLSFLTKTLTSHFDAGTFTGPLIGLATAVAKLMHHILYLGVEFRAALAIHQRLRNPVNLDLSVFADCPLLGAYLLHCAELSMIVPMSFRFTPGWMDVVEHVRHESDGIYVSAQHLINRSPFKIVGIPKIRITNKGAVPIEQIPGVLPGIVGGVFSSELGGDAMGVVNAGVGIGETAVAQAV